MGGLFAQILLASKKMAETVIYLRQIRDEGPLNAFNPLGDCAVEVCKSGEEYVHPLVIRTETVARMPLPIFLANDSKPAQQLYYKNILLTIFIKLRTQLIRCSINKLGVVGEEEGIFVSNADWYKVIQTCLMTALFYDPRVDIITRIMDVAEHDKRLRIENTALWHHVRRLHETIDNLSDIQNSFNLRLS